MTTIYFIIGFILFCFMILAAVDFQTFLDYQCLIRKKKEEIKDLRILYSIAADYSITANPKEAQRIKAKIKRLNREMDKATLEMSTFRTFNRRWHEG